MAGLFEWHMLPTQAVRRACPRTLIWLRRRGRLLSTEGTAGNAQTSGPGSNTTPETVASRIARREKRQAQAAATPTEAAKAAPGAKGGGGMGVGKIVGVAALGTTAYALFRAQEEGSDLRKWYDAQAAGEDGPAFSESLDLFLRSSVLGGAYEAMYEALARPFIEPSRKKLLPDWHSLPGVPPDSIGPPTLILDLEDTLVHATWDPKFGWRYVKRPGADQFLADMSKYFELVIFTSAPFGVVDQVVNSLDKNMVIPHRLYKDSTRFHRGKHVKDLTYLNRDLRHVIIVDDDPDNFQFQPNNGIRIKPYTDITDKTDRSLDRLRKLLVAMVAEGVTDFPAVLKRFQGLDADQIADRYDRMVLEAKMREEERRRKGLGGLLRGVGPMKTHAAPPLPSSDAPRLSAKDIVGGVSTFDEKAEEALHAAPSGPVKKGRWFESYMAQKKEEQEDTQRRLEHWHRQQQKREEEARRQAAGR